MTVLVLLNHLFLYCLIYFILILFRVAIIVSELLFSHSTLKSLRGTL